jgi:hypothetical protein
VNVSILPYLISAIGIVVLIVSGVMVWIRPTPVLVITSGRYGLPGREVDVRERLSELVRDGVLDLFVLPEVLGVDPAPGNENKTMSVRWTYLRNLT